MNIVKCNKCQATLDPEKARFISASKISVTCPVCGKNNFLIRHHELQGYKTAKDGSIHAKVERVRMSKKQRRQIRADFKLSVIPDNLSDSETITINKPTCPGPTAGMIDRDVRPYNDDSL